MREIKFRGRDINGNFVYGLLTKKKIRSSGEIRWAIATGNCSAAETIPVRENSIAQLIGLDANGNEVYETDNVIRIEGDGDFDIEKSFPMAATFEDFAAISDGKIVLAEGLK